MAHRAAVRGIPAEPPPRHVQRQDARGPTAHAAVRGRVDEGRR